MSGCGDHYGGVKTLWQLQRQQPSLVWRLMRYPEAAVDYVVVHELAHIRYKNHGPAFYRLIASVLPDYKERIKLLKQ